MLEIVRASLPPILYFTLVAIAAWAGYRLLRRHYPASWRAFERGGPEPSGARRRLHAAAGLPR